MTENPIVSTASGKLRGSFHRSSLGDDYYAFKGIPYAKPPVGPLRFQDPLPAEPWIGIRNATAYGPMPPQLHLLKRVFDGDEDCLYLNVYTRSIEPNPILRPVMVWIFAGGFLRGNSDDTFYGPDYLLRKDIVLVTINYRLGVLGFLNLEHEVAPGNQGLKDQVLALQWIRNNIENFGGDYNNVTIFGESSGAVIVHYLALSPLAKGLFHKVICQGGVALNPWGRLTHNPKRFAYKMCRLLGNNSRDPKEITDFLRTVDSKTLIENQEKLCTNEETLQLIFPFAPGMDDKSQNPFMPVDPAVAAEEGIQVPLLIGHCTYEGLVIAIKVRKDDLCKLNNNFEKWIHPDSVEMIKKYNLTPIELKHMYCKSGEIASGNYEEVIDLFGDIYIIEGIHRVVKTQVEKKCSPTYLYQFTFDKNPSVLKKVLNVTISGTVHADVIPNIFRVKKLEEENSEPIQKRADAYKVMKQITEMWVNFATTGQPTPTTTELIPISWEPVNSGTNLRYLNIGEELRMDVTCNLEQRYSTHKLAGNKI